MPVLPSEQKDTKKASQSALTAEILGAEILRMLALRSPRLTARRNYDVALKTGLSSRKVKKLKNRDKMWTQGQANNLIK